MDSLTQFTLGAAVSTLCLGKTLGPRKAAILGGLLGTIPDLDVFLPFDSPVDSFVLHRGWTHSVFVHALAAPVIGELLVRVWGPLRDKRALVWLTVFLCFATHAIIDAITVYGTRIFMPLYPDPVGVGSTFIIDPLYALPLLIVVIWALFKGTWTAGFGRAVKTVLVLSTAYLGLSMILQNHIEDRARTIFAKAGIETERVFAIAAPFNTVVWKVIGLEDGRYHNLYLSLFDGDHVPPIHTRNRHPELIACLDGIEAFEKLEWFSRGYYRTELEGGKIVVSDLRMGLTPNYVFRFAVAERTSEGVREIAPERAPTGTRTGDGDLEWLRARLLGQPATRSAEAGQTASATVSAPC